MFEKKTTISCYKYKVFFFIFLINSFNYLINLYEICNKNCAEVSYKQTYFGWLCDVDECWDIVVILLNITRDDEKSYFSTLALQNRYVWFQTKINNNNGIQVSNMLNEKVGFFFNSWENIYRFITIYWSVDKGIANILLYGIQLFF